MDEKQQREEKVHDCLNKMLSVILKKKEEDEEYDDESQEDDEGDEGDEDNEDDETEKIKILLTLVKAQLTLCESFFKLL